MGAVAWVAATAISKVESAHKSKIMHGCVRRVANSDRAIPIPLVGFSNDGVSM